MRCASVVWLVAWLGIFVVQVAAHHAVSSVFDERRTMTLQGTVHRIVNRNPHPSVELVVERKGWTLMWSVEFDAASHLAEHADRIAIRPGDRIVVCGNPGRDAAQYRLRMLTLERPSDGYLLTNPIAILGAPCAP